jgi:general secretion pathway protein G
MSQRQKGRRGFTLIELLVVMAIIALLLTLAAPRYFQSVQRSREAVLREDLHLMRDAIDKHYADTGKYPATLEDLVSKRYLRRVPVDPITESATTWVLVEPPDKPGAQGGQAQGAPGVYDVRSGAQGKSLSGTPYGEM